MTRALPLWDHVLTQARLRPDALAVFGPGGAIGYRALVHDVDALATVLLENGLSRDDMVGLHFGFSYLHLLLILALDRLSIPTMSFATADLATPPAIAPALGLTVVISGAPPPPAAPCRWIQIGDPDRPRFGRIDAARLAQLDSPPDALVRVGWSSGTTGGTKGALITREVQAHRLMARRLLRGVGPRTRYFTGMPFSVASSYATVLTVLSGGGTVLLPVAAGDFVTLANTFGVTLTTTSPARLAELLDGGPAHGRLETVQVFEIVGAALPAELVRRARVQLTAGLAIAYGSSETGRIATGDAALVLLDPAAIGVVLPWAEVEVVDASDDPVAPGREGLLRVRGPQVVSGYFNDAAATQRNFRDGWFHPGDVGVVTADRVLRLTGRIEEMIPQDGALVSPLSIEDGLRTVASVRDVAVFSVPEADGVAIVCAALVLAPGAEPAAVRAEAARHLGARVPERLFVVEQLPRTPSGKVLRRELAEMARREVTR